jgi:purine-nucleoside phosphorylase
MNTAMLEQAYSRVRTALPGIKPRCGLILGSGLADVADNFVIKREMPLGDIWASAKPAIPGHSGKLILGERAGLETLIFCGRHHWYEGLGWEPIAFPVYLLKKLGASMIVLTNAAGAVRADLNAGDVMIIDDHINAMGVHPLVGNTDPVWGPRFPDQSHVYDQRLRGLLDRIALHTGKRISHGTYLAASGPTYETPAEVRAFRAVGADAVGMSTVPEAILASAAGLQVVGLSCMANKAVGVKDGPISHEEVLHVVQRTIPTVKELLAAFWDEVDKTACLRS